MRNREILLETLEKDILPLSSEMITTSGRLIEKDISKNEKYTEVGL